jgi:hypothetical protein
MAAHLAATAGSGHSRGQAARAATDAAARHSGPRQAAFPRLDHLCETGEDWLEKRAQFFDYYRELLWRVF